MFLSALVFFAVFALTALVMAVTSTGRSEEVKQALSRLDAVLATAGKTVDEEVIDVRKKELFSGIPLLNRVLLRLEVATRLRRLLYQADLTWTPGKLLLMSAFAWVIAAYLISLRIDAFGVPLLLALIPAGVPFAYVLYKRSKRLQKFEEGLPPALDLMVTALRGGHSLISALGMVSREAQYVVPLHVHLCGVNP